jgi:hypothetical protein
MTRAAFSPQPSATLAKSTGDRSQANSGLPKNAICSHRMRLIDELLMTTTVTGSWCWASVARPPISMLNAPSPMKATV